jgi:adenosylcobinamide-phosphate synthase
MNSLILLLAMILDGILGEPSWLWSRVTHPIVVMGRAVGWCDKTLNKGTRKRLMGALAISALVILAALAGKILALFGPIVSLIVTAILIAQNSLTAHVIAVMRGLASSLEEGRFAVSMIVSRDTKTMTETNVIRSAIESGSENFSDGVIAPAFWFLVAGLPGIIVYKIVNTADSMIGYRNEKYHEFGWAAARLDDLLNLIPARLSAISILLATQLWSEWPNIAKDAALHKSPNAGWPEAAMAYALGISLAGPRSYDGQEQQFPWVNEAGRKTLERNDITKTVRVLWLAWGAALCLLCVLSIILWLF